LSAIPGVYWHAEEKQWLAVISSGTKLMHLGSFVDEVDAALAYDQAARENHKGEAKLNFPPTRPLELQGGPSKAPLKRAAPQSGSWPDSDTLRMAAEVASEGIDWFDPFVDLAHRVSRPIVMMMVVMKIVMMMMTIMTIANLYRCSRR
jgi:hypothetical protein